MRIGGEPPAATHSLAILAAPIDTRWDERPVLRRRLICATTGTMEIVAHGLWTAAGAIAANRTAVARQRTGWTVWWGIFPDVLAFGPAITMGILLWIWRGREAVSPHAPQVRLGLSLYPIGHSLLVFLAVFALATIVARRLVYELFGWLLHIVIDIPTHSYSYYATRFLWPVSDFRMDGIPWWTPWFWAATYAALAVVYFVIWKKGWLRAARAMLQTSCRT